MFENFGEFNTFEEINELAENLFNEGDFASIKTLAKENGIPEEMAKMYISGDLPCLCDAMTAAVGKLDEEARELKLKGLMKDWISYIECECEESEEVARAVRRKDKCLKKCIAELLKYSFANQWTVPQGILKEAGVKAGKVTFGVPGMGKAREIIAGYYGKGGKKLLGIMYKSLLRNWLNLRDRQQSGPRIFILRHLLKAECCRSASGNS